MTVNEHHLFTCLLSKYVPVGKKYRESQNANITVVVENLTVKLYAWDEEMGQCPMNVSEFKVNMQSFNFSFMITTSPDLFSVHTTYEILDIFPGLLGCFYYSFIF